MPRQGSPQVGVSVKAGTYAKLKAYAQKNHEQVATTVDAIIRAWLDKQGT